MKDTSNFILSIPKSEQETHLWPQTWELVIPRYMIYKNKNEVAVVTAQITSKQNVALLSGWLVTKTQLDVK